VVSVSDLGSKGPGFDPQTVPKSECMFDLVCSPERVHIPGGKLTFVCQSHRVKVKVTTVKFKKRV